MSLKLLGVNGSMRENSFGGRALSITLAAARENGAETRVLELRTADLPMYNPDAGEGDPRIVHVFENVGWAEAFVLASPDYHGSMSGAIKNFLDYHWTELGGKLFGYVCASHEKGLTAMEQMRTAVRQCYGWSVPYGVSIDSQHDFDLEGNMKNHKLQSRLRMLGRDMAVYGSLLRRQFLEDLAKKTPDTFAAKYG
jgi:NAD(P)H-dependent FMN reductase